MVSKHINKLMKIVIRKMQIKMKIKYFLENIKIANIEKIDNIKCFQYGKNKKQSFIFGGLWVATIIQPTWRTV